MFVHLVFAGVVMSNEATLLEAGTSKYLKTKTYVGATLEIEPGTAVTAIEDNAMGQVTHLLLSMSSFHVFFFRLQLLF